MSNIETTRLNTEEKSSQELGFIKVLDSRMIGQEGAKRAAARAKRRAGNPLRNKRGPVYKALLIGKSRTGKTLTAETTALSLHGDVEALVRVDCAEYQHGHEVSRLLGAPPSYVGFDSPPGKGDDDNSSGGKKDGKAPTALLARQNLVASRKGSKVPITVILLDEIEKAHTSLKDVLLAIFDKGKIRLANNVETDFTDCIFFLTSNLGMEQLEQFGRSIGFAVKEATQPTEDDVAQVVHKELRKHFRPEFLKRLDETVIFAPLTQNQLQELVSMELGFVQDRICSGLPAPDWFEVKFKDEVTPHILALTLRNDGGVAEVKQIIEREVIDALGGELEKKTIAGQDLVLIGVDEGGRLTFELGKGQGQPPKPSQVRENKPEPVEVKYKQPSPLQQLRDLIETKLVETAGDKHLSQKTIYFGKEIGTLSKKLGGAANDLDEVQKTFMTAEAHKLLWSKVSNAYWFWKIYQGAAKSATELPIKVSDVHSSLAAIRDLTGISKVNESYNPHTDKPVNTMRYMQEGVLLLEQVEGKDGKESTWVIRVNAIYR
ncbi:MAG: ATP-dependent Clp protease ATP-binding subunit [Cyanobacteria bacterium SZAS LIN-3]|nr:ATP-dependent Clp protease ATP-binding subunit [Cyanobacteria bacterium SZAS LIN-3]MBS2011091.1 ATP-dependent Clp protease ATP-binding subunit [Cyanobacteria bacterium SZAS TMP-1]